jgi:2-oxoglutarate/2-oxoacid ferredoxin oxidoreductase subunit alpha
VVAPEMNLGQLALVLRGKYLVDVQSVSKVQGVAFLADEIGRVIRAALGGTLAEIEQDKAMVARMAAATVEAVEAGAIA